MVLAVEYSGRVIGAAAASRLLDAIETALVALVHTPLHPLDRVPPHPAIVTGRSFGADTDGDLLDDIERHLLDRRRSHGRGLRRRAPQLGGTRRPIACGRDAPDPTRGRRGRPGRRRHRTNAGARRRHPRRPAVRCGLRADRSRTTCRSRWSQHRGGRCRGRVDVRRPQATWSPHAVPTGSAVVDGPPSVLILGPDGTIIDTDGSSNDARRAAGGPWRDRRTGRSRLCHLHLGIHRHAPRGHGVAGRTSAGAPGRVALPTATTPTGSCWCRASHSTAPSSGCSGPWPSAAPWSSPPTPRSTISMRSAVAARAPRRHPHPDGSDPLPGAAGSLRLGASRGRRRSSSPVRRARRRWSSDTTDAGPPAASPTSTDPPKPASGPRTTTARQTSASVPIGAPVPGAWIAVVDEAGRPRPLGVAGELVIGGPGVTIGASQGSHPDAGPGPTFATGDRAVVDDEGRGALPRTYRQPAQRRRRAHRTRGDRARSGRRRRGRDGGCRRRRPSEHRRTPLRGGARRRSSRRPQPPQPTADPARALRTALVDAVGAAPALVAHLEAPNGVDLDHVRNALRAALPAPARPSILVTHASLPRTPNGKLDRTAAMGLSIPTALVAPAGSPEPGSDSGLERAQSLFVEAIGPGAAAVLGGPAAPAAPTPRSSTRAATPSAPSASPMLSPGARAVNWRSQTSSAA